MNLHIRARHRLARRLDAHRRLNRKSERDCHRLPGVRLHLDVLLFAFEAVRRTRHGDVVGPGGNFRIDNPGAVLREHRVAAARRRHFPGESLLDDEPALEFRCAQTHFGDSDRLRRRGNRFSERAREFAGVGRRDIFAAGVLGDAPQLGLRVFLRYVESDDVHSEVGARRLKRRSDTAGIRRAGFDPVGDKDHRRLCFRIFQLFRRKLDRIRHRRLAFGVELLDRAGDCGAVGADGGEFLDVSAVACPSVTVSDEAETAIRRQVFQQVPEDALGDNDFRLAFDLPPHRAGGVKDENRIAGAVLLRGGGRSDQRETSRSSGEKNARNHGTPPSMACGRHHNRDRPRRQRVCPRIADQRLMTPSGK